MDGDGWCPFFVYREINHEGGKAGLAGGNQGAEGDGTISLNYQTTPPVTGALGVIGLAARPADPETY